MDHIKFSNVALSTYKENLKYSVIFTHYDFDFKWNKKAFHSWGYTLPSQIPYPPEYTYPLDTLDTYPKLYPTPWKGPGTSYTLLPGRDMGPEICYTQRTWNQGRGRTWHQRYPTPPPCRQSDRHL